MLTPRKTDVLDRLAAMGSPTLALPMSGSGANHGLVSALPSEPTVGDTCIYKADVTNGSLWPFVYTGLGTYPWWAIGAEPLTAEIETSEATSSLEYTNLATVGPSITVPLKGDYRVNLGAYIVSGAAAVNSARMAIAVGAAAANDEDAVVGVQKENLGLGSVARHRMKLGISAAGTAIVCKYKVQSASPMNFRGRWLTVQPRRVAA